MRNVVLLSMLAALALPVAAAAQPPNMRGGNPLNRRAVLERQILQRFVQQSATEMRLTPDRRDRLERWLTESSEERRDLAEHAGELRRRLTAAVGDASTSDAEFERILDDMNRLRQREYDLWRKDEEELSRTLTPRQRAHFALRLLRFQDMIESRRDQQRPPGDEPIVRWP